MESGAIAPRLTRATLGVCIALHGNARLRIALQELTSRSQRLGSVRRGSVRRRIDEYRNPSSVTS